MSTAEAAIAVDGLTWRHGGHAVVDDLSFTVGAGRVTAFLGPNGAGKTTTIRMVLGLLRPTAGRALVLGHPYHELPDPGRRVGVLLDAAAAHPARTVRDHLRVMAAERGLPAHRVVEALDVVDLSEAMHTRVRALSLGMRQRLGLAAALLGDPELLVLDEPANGLDPAGIRWLRGFLRGFVGTGRSVFVSSHQLGEASLLADDVVVVDRGRLVVGTTITDLIADSVVHVRTPTAAALVEKVVAAGGAARATSDDTIEVTGLPIEQVGGLASRAGIELHELAPRTTTLEDVFLSLTGGGGGRG